MGPPIVWLARRGRRRARPTDRGHRVQGAVSKERMPEGRSGTKVWRSSRGVHRTTGPWTPTVHAFLRHLETVGFAGAPRVLGIDGDGREVLSFIDGDVLADPRGSRAIRRRGPGGRSPRSASWRRPVCSAGCTTRRDPSFRRTTPSGDSTTAPRWVATRSCVTGTSGRTTPCTAAGRRSPSSTGTRSRPNHPLVEFGNAAWHFVPLGDDAYFEASGFPSAARSRGAARTVRTRVRRGRPRRSRRGRCTKPSSAASKRRSTGRSRPRRRRRASADRQ